jgi:hypothetical protein
MPDISDELACFLALWWEWWQNLQPSWRTQRPLLLSREVPKNPDWSDMEKGTANGFFIIILVLGWWALGLKYAEVESGTAVEDFQHAMEDTTWVLHQMALPQSSSSKRGQSEADDTTANAK